MKSKFSLSFKQIKNKSVVTSVILKVFFILSINAPGGSIAQPNTARYQTINQASVSIHLNYPKLVKQFYQLNGNDLFWFTPNENTYSLRQWLITAIDSCAKQGLKKEKYHINEITKSGSINFSEKDTASALLMDGLFTDAAISYCKDLYQGNNSNALVMSDEISAKYNETDNQFLLKRLASVSTKENLLLFFKSIEPADPEYIRIKNELQLKRNAITPLQIKQVVTSLQLYRWIHHFKFDKWIVVNVASATLRYYETDSLQLRMKVIVGKPSTRTPRFAAYCNQIILYPYWNVPASIAVNELLPMFKKDPGNVDYLNMQILNSKGNVIDHHSLNWKNYSRNYFPFRIRQSTGCDNSLGVIKFNLTSPFSVYLHDTNNKKAFLSDMRYYSHGCIRVEEPIKLANYLLPNKIDSAFLASCLKDQIPISLSVKPVPVFVIYQTVETDIAGQLKYFKDVYHLL